MLVAVTGERLGEVGEMVAVDVMISQREKNLVSCRFPFSESG